MKKSSLKRLVFAAMSVCAVMLYGASKNADDVVIENARFRLTIGADAIVNVRYASSAIMQSAAEVIAYGTDVRFK